MGSPRTLQITYGGYTVGGDAASALLDGGYSITPSYEFDLVQFAAVIFASSASDFATKTAAFEAAFSKPRQALTITLGASTVLSRDPSANTGFNAEPSCAKDQHAADTGLSRRYTVTLRIAKPANLSGQGGRRNAAVALSYDPADRITVTFRGEYTALASNGALAQFNAAAETYFTGYLTGVSGTFEKVSQDLQQDDTDKVLGYTVVYREILFDQTDAGRDHAAIVEHNVAFARALEAPGDYGKGTVRLTDVLATYTCHVKKSTTGLEALYASTLRSFILTQAKELFSPIATAVVFENPTFDVTSQRVQATLRLKMAIGTKNVIEAQVTQELADDPGKVITPVWDGSPFGAHVDPGPATRIRTTNRRYLVLGGASLKKWIGGGGGDASGAAFYADENGSLLGSSGFAGGGQGSTSGWVLLPSRSSVSPRRYGTTDDGIDVTEYTEIKVERYVTPPGQGASGFQSNFLH